MDIETNVVKGRLRAAKYIMLVVIISAFFPYKLVTWAPYAVSAFYVLWITTIMYCLFTWLVARIVNADKIAVSAGVAPSTYLYNFKRIDILCGIFPLPDVAIPASVVVRPFKCWAITTLPTILMIVAGLALEPLRDHLYDTSPGLLTVFQCPVYSVVAMIAVACFLVAFIIQILIFEKWKLYYPHLSGVYNLLEIAFAIAGGIMGYKYGSSILNFIHA